MTDVPVADILVKVTVSKHKRHVHDVCNIPVA